MSTANSTIPDDVRRQIKAACRGKNAQLAEHVYDYLSEHNPDSVRGVMYEMLGGPLLDMEYEDADEEAIGNKRYRRVQGLLLSLRRKGIIPWAWIRDGVRSSTRVSAWDDLAAFMDTVRDAYRRDPWRTQDVQPHIIVEKDSAAGRCLPVTEEFAIWLHPLRGESSDTFCLDIARCIKRSGKPAAILFVGDWDPCGLNLERVAKEKIEAFLGHPAHSWERVALTEEQVDEMGIRTLRTKKGRDRDKKTGREKNSPERQWRAVHGDRCAEVEAVPIETLRDMLRGAVRSWIDDEGVWDESMGTAEEEQERLEEFVDGLSLNDDE
jgi:hypothetical protein